MAEPLKITVLGSGTSVGVPSLGCHCAVCTSTDRRDNRLRPSVLVSYRDRQVVIDTTPDFRAQALRARLDRVDAVLFTHGHFDHIMGLDDVRPFNLRQKGRIPIYAAPDTMATLERVFDYIFTTEEQASWVAKLDPRPIDGGALDLFGLPFLPVPVLHGTKTIYGFRFGAAAYLTDHSAIPESSLDLLRGLDVLFLDALRYKPHPTHSTVQRSIETVERLAPRRAFFTHLCHDLGHERAESMLPPHIRLAFDGMEILVDGGAQ
jgi:phosphoribosyl 1,2-cyclic phosphate phosphodiesterase